MAVARTTIRSFVFDIVSLRFVKNLTADDGGDDATVEELSRLCRATTSGSLMVVPLGRRNC